MNRKSRNGALSSKGGAEEPSLCVLLYSGGLDTSCMLRWILENYSCDLITLTLDVGQRSKDFLEVKRKALKLGAKEAVVVDAKKEFADGYIGKAIKANALYQGEYPLSTAIARPLKAKWAVKIAEEKGADAVAHGCSGKGNDQVRFDVTISTLNPDLAIIAPVREWGMTRDEEIEYAKKEGIPLSLDTSSCYSIDENLWGRSCECGDLELPEKEIPVDALGWITPPWKAPNTPEYVELDFVEGLPAALNGKEMDLWELIVELNDIAGGHGVGIIDHMEDRIVGLKTRELYECPAATVILKAHRDLEKYVCTRHENSFKPMIDQKWTEMAYYGLWVDPLMDALEAFIERMNEKVEGSVKVKLFKGNALVVGRDSPRALYDLKLATYEKDQTFNQEASKGFIELWGLQSRMANRIRKRRME